MKKILMIIGGVVVVLLVCAGGFIYYQFQTSDQFVCESESGTITLLYDEDSINGYMANGISYDLEAQKAYAKQVGIEVYLKEFNEFFQANMNGNCHKK